VGHLRQLVGEQRFGRAISFFCVFVLALAASASATTLTHGQRQPIRAHSKHHEIRRHEKKARKRRRRGSHKHKAAHHHRDRPTSGAPKRRKKKAPGPASTQTGSSTGVTGTTGATGATGTTSGGDAPATPADRYIPIGTAVNLPDLTGSDPRYQATLAANFTAITPENEMKWDTTEPEQGVFNFGPADQLVSYALAHGMSVHGHNLVWNQQLPSWLTSGTWTAAQLEAILKQHILTEVGHFAGEVNEWDVINEPFNNDGTLQSNIWLNTIGPDYIPMALEWAHEADPSAKLFINDYDIDWPGPKEQAMLALATQLKQEGVPLDGIGMEEHVSLSWSPSPAQLAQAMQDFASLGLDVEVTEADVDTIGFSGTQAEAESQQAQVFSELASACRAQPACIRFTVWGVSDAVSWLGTAAAALPFDANYLPKPAWSALLSGLANPPEPGAGN
jgi:endo-1,4-beta-xylanase